MKPDTELLGGRFQFSDSSKTVVAELLVTEIGLRLQLFDFDGPLIAEFLSSVTDPDQIAHIIIVLSAFGYARMVIDSDSAAA